MKRNDQYLLNVVSCPAVPLGDHETPGSPRIQMDPHGPERQLKFPNSPGSQLHQLPDDTLAQGGNTQGVAVAALLPSNGGWIVLGLRGRMLLR
jgi:hypothetical protein